MTSMHNLKWSLSVSHVVNNKLAYCTLWLLQLVTAVVLVICYEDYAEMFKMAEIRIQLENVAIANALQREAARRRAVPIRFN